MSEAAPPPAPEAPQTPPEAPQTPETPPVDDATAELEALRAERDQLKKNLQSVEQKDMSEQEKELSSLKEELKTLAMTKILNSKLFKEKDLADYDYKQLKAMGDVVDRIQKTSGKTLPPRAPEQTPDKNKVIRGYKPNGDPYY